MKRAKIKREKMTVLQSSKYSLTSLVNSFNKNDSFNGFSKNQQYITNCIIFIYALLLLLSFVEVLTV